MELSSEANVRKILLDFSEYERLKHIEAQYIEERKQKVSRQQSGKGECEFENSQTGGASGEFDKDITPPIAVKDVKEETFSQLPPIHYNLNVSKNDLNDTFDEKKLLSLVPKNQIGNAKFLLKQFDQRANELTWNSSGTIFINQSAIPSSNIFIFFPLLFKKNNPKIDGFLDFVQKINDMGLSDLILAKSSLKNYEPNEITVGQGLIEKAKITKDVPWWYIGD